MARPGIMLYFDILEPIRVLSDADKGRLLVAMLEYGQCGKMPQFDGMLALAWGFVQPKLDRDGETYENSKVQRQYAAFCKKRAKVNLPKIPFEEWLNMSENERQRMLTADNEPLRPVDFVASRYPSTSTSTSAAASASASTPTSASAAAAGTISPEEIAAATADRKLKYFQGELGQGVVLLSEEQVGSLLDILGLDAFDHYVSKLANFIIKNNATVMSHYETILKWWKEDSNVHR